MYDSVLTTVCEQLCVNNCVKVKENESHSEVTEIS